MGKTNAREELLNEGYLGSSAIFCNSVGVLNVYIRVCPNSKTNTLSKLQNVFVHVLLNLKVI